MTSCLETRKESKNTSAAQLKYTTNLRKKEGTMYHKGSNTEVDTGALTWRLQQPLHKANY